MLPGSGHVLYLMLAQRIYNVSVHWHRGCMEKGCTKDASYHCVITADMLSIWLSTDVVIDSYTGTTYLCSSKCLKLFMRDA